MKRGDSKIRSDMSDSNDLYDDRSKDVKKPRRSRLVRTENQDNTQESDFRDSQDQLEEILQGDPCETVRLSLYDIRKRMKANILKSVEQSEYELITRELGRSLEVLPNTLINILSGFFVHGDCGRPLTDKPDWLDMDEFLRGQKFARDHLVGVYFAELLSLFALFCFEEGLNPMIITEASSTPYTAFKRYLSTAIRVRNWYTEDPWTKGTLAYKDIQIVRMIHKNVRQKLDSSSEADIDAAAKINNVWCPSREMLLADFQSACPPPVPGQCPYALLKTGNLSQGEMACTQFGFVGLCILYPKAFGLHGATEDDLKAFCHVWRGIGYLLGIQDEYNFCRGSLEDVRQRSRDFLELWVKPNLREVSPEWEHMMRCAIGGLQYYFPGTSYEGALLYFTEILGIPMPRLHVSISYMKRFRYKATRYMLLYASRWPSVTVLLNRKLNQAINRGARQIKNIDSKTVVGRVDDKVTLSNKFVIVSIFVISLVNIICRIQGNWMTEL